MNFCCVRNHFYVVLLCTLIFGLIECSIFMSSSINLLNILVNVYFGHFYDMFLNPGHMYDVEKTRMDVMEVVRIDILSQDVE